MQIRLASKLTKESIVDGPGLRAVIWTQGCKHNCPGCHNKDTHNFQGGFITTTEEIIEEIKKLRLHRGITFSGGDPMEQPEACYQIAVEAKKLGLNIWCYTGYTYEELKSMNNEFVDKFLSTIDILIDGKYEETQRDLMLNFRGSKNQRVINMNSSIEQNELVLDAQYA